MRINSITDKLNNNYNFNSKNNIQTTQNTNKSNPIAVLAEYPIPFLGRVDKRLVRFEPYHDLQKRLPTTLKEYLDTVKDKLSITPPDAMKNAYAGLMEAKSIQDVQRLFPNEELFIYLTTLKNTASKVGIIGIYKEFEDIFSEGILKSGEDFTVYLLRKLFVETKVYNDINEDLDNDLNPDVKFYFKQKYDNNEYISTEVLRALEIYPPDQDFRNSLKFTKEGYSDRFGLTISEALLRRLKNMTEEEKTAEINNRGKGLEEWWNRMSYEEKMALATSVDIQEEGYKSYKKYDNQNRRENRKYLESLPDFLRPEPEKKVKTGIKLSDKDVYVLWMQNNLAKFYNSLSEEEKTAFDIERSASQAARWQKMTQDERIDFIKSIRDGIEPLRFAMIDTWNHSRLLIRILSEYMKEQQVFKPPYLLYDTSEFIEFQSRIMTEFWAQNKDLAQKFGERMKYSHHIVKNAIREGKFEELKKQILAEKEERIRILKQEYQAAEDEIKKVEANEIKKVEEAKIKEKEADIPKEEVDFQKEFAEFYKKSIDQYGILPAAYTEEMTEIFINSFSKDLVVRYTNALKDNEAIPQDIKDYIAKEQEKNELPRLNRIQRALEAAIAAEMTSKKSAHALFLLDVSTLISLLNLRYSQNEDKNEKRVDIGRISKLYKEYDRDLSDDEINTIANTYFSAKRTLTKEENELFENYLKSYGRSLLILFSDKSAYSDAIKSHFNEKFLKLMPKDLKEFVDPFIQTSKDLYEEKAIGNMTAQIYKRFKYIPADILKIYARELAYAIRMDRLEKHSQNWLNSFSKTFSTKASQDMGQIFPNIVKRLLSGEEKLKFIALEQAMADEFYRVTKKEEAYAKNFEELLNYFDMLSIMKKNEKLNLTTEDDSVMFSVNEKPETKYIFAKYVKYLNALKENKILITSDSDKNVVIPVILYSLNTNRKQSSKNKYIAERLLPYFMTEEDYEVRGASKQKDDYKKDFIRAYKSHENKYNLLPNSYIRDMSNIILETFPQNFVEKYTQALSQNAEIPKDITKTLAEESSKNNNPKLAKIQRALECAIATELINKGGTPLFMEMTADSLIPVLIARANNKEYKKPDVDVIHRTYDYLKQDLTEEELENIVNHYFLSLDQNPAHSKENDRILMDYINEYGKSMLLLFTDTNNNVSNKIRYALNDKFLKLMPQKVKNIARPLLAGADDIDQENDLNLVRKQIAQRFDFIPKKALDTYTQEVATAIRVYKQPEATPEYRKFYNLEKVKNELCKKKIDSDGGVSIFRIPKDTLKNSSKLQLLAAEQALADELYRISGSGVVYKYELEDLATWFELLAPLKKRNEIMEMSNPNGDKFVVKQKPNINIVNVKFNQYMNEFTSRDDLYLENGDIDKEIVLYCLNPYENMPQKDELIKKRIDIYFEN